MSSNVRRSKLSVVALPGMAGNAALNTVKNASALPGSAVKAVGTTAKFGVGTVMNAGKGTAKVGLSATKFVTGGVGGVGGIVTGVPGTAIKSLARATKRRFRQKDITQAWPTRLTSPEIKIDLCIQCRNLPQKDAFAKADSFCVVWEVPPGYLGTKTRLGRQYRHPTRQETELGRTEVVRGSSNPSFTQTFRVDFKFETEQTYCIRVYDQDSKYETDVKEHDYLGGAVLSLGRLMGSPGSTVFTPLEDDEGAQLLVKGVETVETREVLESRFAAEIMANQDKVLETMDPLFRFEALNLETQTWKVVWKSEVVQASILPTWSQNRTPVPMLCHDVPSLDRKDLKISLWNLNRGEKEEPIGSVETSVLALAQEGIKGIPTFNVYREKKRGFSGVLTYAEKRKVGTLKVLKADVREVPSFLSYINGGCQLDLIVAVDFSKGNGDHILEDSLHYRRDNWLNDYQVAIHKLGTIMECYTHRKQYTMWGYGANMSGESVPYIEMGKGHMSGSEGMLRVYERTCDNPFVQPIEETTVNPVIQAAAYRSIIKAKKEQRYTVLCILTAGSISDVQLAIDSICTASEDSPLSIVFIGVGEKNFDAIKVLAAGNGELRHSNGVPISRDLVNFVAFSDHGNNPTRVISEGLSAIPEQLVRYFHDNGVKPQPHQEPPDADKVYEAYKARREHRKQRHHASGHHEVGSSKPSSDLVITLG